MEMSSENDCDVQKMPHHLRLRKNDIYEFKRKVPLAARSAFNGCEVVSKSLGTKDYKVALIRLKEVVKEFDIKVARAKSTKSEHGIAVEKSKQRTPGTTKYLRPGHIKKIIEGYVYGLLSTDDEERKGMTKEERLERIALLEEGLEQMLEDSAVENLERWDDVVEHQLAAQALIAPEGSDLRIALRKKLVDTDIEMMRVQIDRLRGNRYETPSAPTLARHLLTMLDVYNEWEKSQKNIKTRDTYRMFVAEFEAVVGAQPVVSITTDDVLKYRNHLAKLGLNRLTADNRIGGLATLIRYAKNKAKLIPKEQVNPFDEINTDFFIETLAHEARRPFSDEELSLLFDSKLYTQGYVPTGQAKEALYWTPLLGLFAGLRMSELAQLQTQDIRAVLDVPCILITDTEKGNRIKNSSSRRLIPVHAELVKCGFLDYVEARRSVGGGRLFPSLSNENKYESWSNALGKTHGRYLDGIGLDDIRLDDHSYRYNFSQQCTWCDVSFEIREVLMGHSLDEKKTNRRYQRGADGFYPIQPLAVAIKNLRYPNLRLDHMYKKIALPTDLVTTPEEHLLHAKGQRN